MNPPPASGLRIFGRFVTTVLFKSGRSVYIYLQLRIARQSDTNLQFHAVGRGEILPAIGLFRIGVAYQTDLIILTDIALPIDPGKRKE